MTLVIKSPEPDELEGILSRLRTATTFSELPTKPNPVVGSTEKLRKVSAPLSEVEKTLNERGSRYGQFKDHAVIAQGIQDVMRKADNWTALDPDMRQALSVIADKIARILNGDPNYTDSWHDIQGYAKLVEARLISEGKAV